MAFAHPLTIARSLSCNKTLLTHFLQRIAGLGCEETKVVPRLIPSGISYENICFLK